MEKCRKRQVSNGLSFCGLKIGYLIEDSVIFIVDKVLQVKDNNIKNKDKVFTFNGWTFASSPTLNPFDHPIYDIWLTKCLD